MYRNLKDQIRAQCSHHLQGIEARDCLFTVQTHLGCCSWVIFWCCCWTCEQFVNNSNNWDGTLYLCLWRTNPDLIFYIITLYIFLPYWKYPLCSLLFCYKNNTLPIFALWCGVAQLVARRLARLGTTGRVFPLSLQSDEEMERGPGKWRRINVLYECDRMNVYML